MNNRHKKTVFRPIGSRLNNIGANAIRRSAEAIFRPEPSTSSMSEQVQDSIYEDDNLAPVMPAIDVVQQMIEEENRNKLIKEKQSIRKSIEKQNSEQHSNESSTSNALNETSIHLQSDTSIKQKVEDSELSKHTDSAAKLLKPKVILDEPSFRSSIIEPLEEEDRFAIVNNPLNNFINLHLQSKPEDYEFIPKSVTLDVYSNDPEVKRFLKQLPRIGNEFGYNEQDYKCYACRRPVGMVFGHSRLCHYDGHHYCTECHLGDKSIIPARILCNWDFNKYPISKRNQHFLNLISNEPMFELKTIAPLLYKTCSELKEVEELRCQAFFIKSYCFTCVQDSISFELTKLVWPREHLLKQIDIYSLEDLIQIKSGALKQLLRNVITFGRQHVLSCMLCCQKGFICELCKSSQIIYPFDTETVYRCNSCQSIYHKTCFRTRPLCPRCLRLKARRNESS